ncbi:MAG: hypothetical protein PHX30_01445 [Candidatus Pacebacteria bacterium]|nr:hypothetical protein [Candidatus Paceibacterota bacterium]
MSETNSIKNLEEFIKKVDDMKKQDKMDLSSDQDLTIAIMNLISIEEHFFFTGAKLGKPEYYDLIKEVREMRKSLLKRIIKDPEGEVWCISKHLLSGSERLMEVGTKQLGMGNKEVAAEMFDKAYSLYSLFWGINMNLIDLGEIKKIDDDAMDKSDMEDKTVSTEKKEYVVAEKKEFTVTTKSNMEKKGVMSSLKELVKKAVDCCIE